MAEKLVRYARTRGKKFEIEVTRYEQANGEVRYKIQEFENRRSVSTGVGYTEEEIGPKWDRTLYWAKELSNINYQEVEL